MTTSYTISGDRDPNREYLTPAQALACLETVRTYLGPDCDPKLYRDHEGPFWNISFEGGPEDWAYHINEPDAVTWPAGVYVETIAAGWCIGLYPVSDPEQRSKAQSLARQWESAVADGNAWAQQKIGAEMARHLQR